MKNGTITQWLLGALMLLTVGAWGANFALITARLDRIEDKVERIQAEYGRIATLEFKLGLLLERSAGP